MKSPSPECYLSIFQTVWWTIWHRKIFQIVLCPTQLFQWKLICNFNQHCLSYKISSRLQFNSSFFLKTLRNCVALTQIFQRCAARSKDVLVHKDRYIYLLWAILEGKLVIVYRINYSVLYKTTCSESESRNFRC